MLALRRADRVEVAIQRIGPIPVIDDDEVAIARKLVREGDRAFVDTADGLSVGNLDLHAIAGDGGAEAAAGLAAEAAEDRAGGRRPWHVAAEGPQRQGSGCAAARFDLRDRSEEHTSELQSPCNLVCRLLLEKKKRPR